MMRRTTVLVCSLVVVAAACSGTGVTAQDASADVAGAAGSAATDETTDGDGPAATDPGVEGDGGTTPAAVEEDVPAADDGAATTGTGAAVPATGTDGAADDERPTVEALWWTAATLDGGTLDSASLAGERVVLWMWAPWCSVCNAEAPDVARALADLPDDVTVIGVAGRDDLEPMREFVATHGLDGITHVVDDDGALWASYGVSYQPAWVFIAPDGATSVAAGALGYDGLFEALGMVFDG